MEMALTGANFSPGAVRFRQTREIGSFDSLPTNNTSDCGSICSEGAGGVLTWDPSLPGSSLLHRRRKDITAGSLDTLLVDATLSITSAAKVIARLPTSPVNGRTPPSPLHSPKYLPSPREDRDKSVLTPRHSAGEGVQAGALLASLSAKETDEQLERVSMSKHLQPDSLSLRFQRTDSAPEVDAAVVEKDFGRDYTGKQRNSHTSHRVRSSLLLMLLISFNVWNIVPNFLASHTEIERLDPNGGVWQYWTAVALFALFLITDVTLLVLSFRGTKLHLLEPGGILICITWVLFTLMTSACLIATQLRLRRFPAVIIPALLFHFACSGLHIRWTKCAPMMPLLLALALIQASALDALDAELVISVVSAAVIQLAIAYSLEFQLRQDWLKRQVLHAEQLRCVVMIQRLLPVHAMTKLTEQCTQVADTWADVAMLLVDIVGFTAMSASVTPDELVAFLDQLYTTMDEVVDAIGGVMKVETIGDCYWCCSDLAQNDPNKVEIVTQVALEMMERVALIQPPGDVQGPLKLRCGLHVGPVLGGIVGSMMPRYHLFGKHVQIVQLMEQMGVPCEVTASEEVANRLDPERFVVTWRHTVTSQELERVALYKVERKPPVAFDPNLERGFHSV